MAHSCGAKHVLKSKCAKHTMLGPLFGSWDVEKWYAALAQSAFTISQNVKKIESLGPRLEARMSKNGSHCGAKTRIYK